MHTGGWVLQVALFAVAATFTPGPNALLLVSMAASYGLRPAVPAAVGVWIGIPSLIVVVGIGLGEAFVRVGWLQPVLHVVATIYIAWLVWTILRTRPPQNMPSDARPIGLAQAVVLQWINPKVWTMAIGATGAYAATADPVGGALAVGAVFAVVCLPAVTMWTLCGGAVRRWLTTPALFTAFRVTMGALLIGSILLTWIS